MNKKWLKRRKRLYEILKVGNDLDRASRWYDYLDAFSIVLNLIVSVMYTYAEMKERYGDILAVLEAVTVTFFAVDYVLRIWTAGFLYAEEKPAKAVIKYLFSFGGIVDFLSCVPYYLPVFFPAGTVAFRMIRIVRIFRLFKINAYQDSLNVITDVIRGKKQQLISSVFTILVLMLAASQPVYV